MVRAVRPSRLPAATPRRRPAPSGPATGGGRPGAAVVRRRKSFSRRDLTARCRQIALLLFDCDGVLTDGRITYGDGFEIKTFSARDGMGVSLANRAGLPCGCVTGRTSAALARRAEELRFAELHQGIGEKLATVTEILARRGLQWEQLAYVGDDLNDLAVLARAGLAFAPADAHPEARAAAQVVLATRGGDGAVREAIDLILAGSGRLESALATFREPQPDLRPLTAAATTGGAVSSRRKKPKGIIS